MPRRLALAAAGFVIASALAAFSGSSGRVHASATMDDTCWAHVCQIGGENHVCCLLAVGHIMCIPCGGVG
jgi:hypothetical protein